MVYVVLRNGKTIQYNAGGVITVEDGMIVVRYNDAERHLIARIPAELVERAEFARPCRVMTRKQYK